MTAKQEIDSEAIDSASVLIDYREKAVEDNANPLASGCEYDPETVVNTRE